MTTRTVDPRLREEPQVREPKKGGNSRRRGMPSLAKFGQAWQSAGVPFRAYLMGGLGLAFVYFFAPPGWGHHLIYDTLGMSSVVAILWGVHRYKPANPWVWYLFALGNFAFVVGDATRAWYEVVQGVESPFPGLADVGYLAAYPILIAGMVLLVRGRDKDNDRANVIDSLILTVSAAVVLWVYLMEPYTKDPTITVLEMIISITYPLMDLLILGMAARIMISPGARPAAYYLLMVSISGLFISDCFYIFGLLNGWYVTGNLVDAGWLISYVLWGAAALHPSMTELAKPLPHTELSITRRRLLTLTLVTLLAPIVRIIESMRGNDPSVGSTVVPTVVLFLLVMARMSGLVQKLTTALHRHQDAERRRRQSEARFGSLIQHASDVVTVVDPDGEVTFQSPSVRRALGYKRQELIKQPLTELIHEEDRAAALSVLQQVTTHTSDDPASMRFRWRHRDGGWRDMEATVTNLLDDPTVAGIVLNARDVTEQVALQAQLAHQAFHDSLTDLANRALFQDRVEHALDRRSAPDEPIAVLFLDIDDFKTVNDSL